MYLHDAKDLEGLRNAELLTAFLRGVWDIRQDWTIFSNFQKQKNTSVGNRLLGWEIDKQVGNFLEVCGTSWRDACKSPRCAEKCVMQVWTDMLLFQSTVESFFPRLLGSPNAQGIAWQVWKHWNMCKNIWDHLNVPIYIWRCLERFG